MLNASPSGILNLDKPVNLTSAAVLNRLKRILPRSTKIGHAGTLDPFASGVLLVLIGGATRQCEAMMNQPKTYDAEITFGATTPTDDPESTPVPLDNVIVPTEEAIAAALRDFVGTPLQRPPAYSALKIGGRRAYDLARKGAATPLAPRVVKIDSIDIVAYGWPRLRVKISCGRGTYIRAIARDLGNALRVGGYLTALRRTRIGPFGVETAAKLDDLLAGGLERLAPLLQSAPL